MNDGQFDRFFIGFWFLGAQYLATRRMESLFGSQDDSFGANNMLGCLLQKRTQDHAVVNPRLHTISFRNTLDLLA
jgi:hypothetical protein